MWKIKLKKLGKKCKGLIIADWPMRDTDKMLSFLNAAKRLNRKLAISTRQAYLLKLLEECKDEKIPKLNDQSICVYAIRKGWGVLRKNFPERIQEQDYESWEKPFLKNCVECQCLSKSPQDYIWFCSNFDLKELIDIKPKNSFYIKSACEPFDIEMEIEQERVNNWLEHFKIKSFRTHVSGHAPGNILEKSIKKIKPKIIFPIHTQKPRLFKKFGNVKIVKYGKEYKLDKI